MAEEPRHGQESPALRWGVLAVGLAAGIEVALVIAGAPTWAMAPLGVPLSFVLPGYVWMMVFRPTGGGSLSGVVISVMGSIGFVIVSGLLIDALPTGLTARNQICALAIVVAAGGLTGLLTDLRRGVTRQPRQPLQPLELRRSTALKLLLAAVCVAAAAVLTLSSQHTINNSEHFTVLSLAGTQTNSPIVTVTSHQPIDVSYELSVESKGRVLLSRRVRLSPGQAISEDLAQYMLGLASGSQVQVTIARPGSSKPDRQAWFAVSA